MSRNTGWSWLNLTANGNIRPARVVIGVTGAGNALKAVEAGDATEAPFGITKENTRFPPGSPQDDGLHAVAGELVTIYQPGEIGYALSGAAITDARKPLIASANGTVISLPAPTGSTPTRFWCIGFPRNTCASGEKVEVIVTAPFLVVQNA